MAVEISRMDFLKKFSRTELCFTHTFKIKFHAKNWLSRILSNKNFTEDLHFFTYKKKTLHRAITLSLKLSIFSGGCGSRKYTILTLVGTIQE